jgi:Tfp pilus assembly protein PilE
MRKRFAFTMIELIFVIVVMGIIGKFGVEFLAQAYKSFIFSNVNNSLQEKSAYVVEFLATRLQYRIKNSVIAREDKDQSTYTAIGNVDNTKTYTVLEWVQSDIEGFRGVSQPYWSAIADIDAGNSTTLVSPETNTSSVNDQILYLSYGKSNVTDTALYFIGSNNDIDGYGWDGNALTDQTGVMHPVKDDSSDSRYFIPREGGTQNSNAFSNDVYEYYKLAWTANAVTIEEYDDATGMGNLYFYYNYQPWDGEHIRSTTSSDIERVLLMKNVSTFKFLALGSILKIQICTKSDLIEEYSLCKEKTIF